MAISAESASGSQGTPTMNLDEKSISSVSPIPAPVQINAAASQSRSTTLDRDDNGDDVDQLDNRSRKPKKKGPRKRLPKPRVAILGDQTQIVRDQINLLKDQLQTATATKEENQKTQYAIEQLEEVYAKLSAITPPPARLPPKNHGLTSDETLTMLHFFYMVRLAQKGFFSLVPDMFAGIEMEAIVYFCDRLVGSSLFLAPNNNPEQQVFNLLRKLHDGVDEPVGPNYTTTYSQIRHAVQHAIKASLNPPLHPSEQQSVNTLQPPVWVVVPFNSMIDLPQQQQCFQQQAQSSVAAFSTPINTSKVKAVDPKYPAKTTAGTHPPQPPAQVVDSNNPSPVLSAAAKENHEDPRQNESVPDDHSHHDESVHGNMHHHTESTEEEHSSHNETTEGTCQHPNESGEGADGEPSRQTESLDGENDQDTGECFEGESGGRGARGRGSRGRGYRRGRGRGRGTYSPRGSGGRGRGSSRGIGSGKIWVPHEATG